MLVLCKGALGHGATALAQGGLAAALAPDDSAARHVRDTLIAGAGLCADRGVRDLVTSAPGELARLRALGARFDSDPAGADSPALTREAGHSRERVVHAGGDATGAEVQRCLVAAVRRSHIEVLEHAAALDAVLDETGTVVGVRVGRIGGAGGLDVGEVRARAIVLATGGLGQAWAVTTNPAGATGDGLALALRAGAEVRDLEFVQFHPTVLWCGPAARGRLPLVSEAVRGEGAVLVDGAGRPVMAGAHPLGDLAPRDVVAAVMHRRMVETPGGVATHLYLDATRLGGPRLGRRFPTLLANCRAIGVDPARDPIPVAPGAHYACGGVVADLAGRTSVVGLFAVGEVASTGVHGANRLASNSLTEALLAGRRCGELLAARLPRGGEPVTAVEGSGVAAGSRLTTAQATSRDAGVLRSPEGLARLLQHLATAPDGPSAAGGAGAGSARGGLTLEIAETTALHTVATLVATAALLRPESRGCHRRTDVAEPVPAWRRNQTLRLTGNRLEPTTPARERAA